MAEHTPGPWTAEIEAHSASSARFAANVYTGNPYLGTYRSVARVCEPEHGYDGDEQARAIADAHLMAAAPEMLACLESVYEDLVDYGKRLSEAYSTGSIALLSCADQVHRTIQKAKGKAENA